jgi:hypothetical protein
MDVHQDLKPPAKGIAHSLDHNRHARVGQFGVGQPSPITTPKAPSTACSTAPTDKLSAATATTTPAPGVPCSDVHQVDSLI